MIHTLDVEGGVLDEECPTGSAAKLTAFFGLAGGNPPLEPEVSGQASAFVIIEAESRSSSSIARFMTPSMHPVQFAEMSR